jgi:hypothetical protein
MRTHKFIETAGMGRAYESWAEMIKRCYNPNCEKYKDYGARGITVCEQWVTNTYKGFGFKVFLTEMGERPEGRQLDRIDNSKGYCKENCRWATPTQNAQNKRVYKTNLFGISGVVWHSRMCCWQVSGSVAGKKITLYSGKDYLEACCARKSWENTRASTP